MPRWISCCEEPKEGNGEETTYKKGKTMKSIYVIFWIVIALFVAFDIGRVFGRAESRHAEYETRQSCVDSANQLLKIRRGEMERGKWRFKNSLLGVSLVFVGD